MVEAAKRAGTACGIAHEFRFVPQIQALRQLIVNDHLAPLREIESTYFRPILQRESSRPRSWWFERERGGGITGAIGSHLIDQCTHLAGRPPKRATGFRRLANPHRRDDAGIFTSTVDDGTFALLDYGDGLIARITVDGTPSVESFTCAVHAENRTAVASGKSLVELTLFSIDPDETSELGCKPSPYAKYESINSNVPLLMELYDEWVKQIETGSSALPTFQEGLVTQEVLSAIGYSI
jgi:predicted dehydrogenase